MCKEEEVGEVVEVALAVLGLDAHRLHRQTKRKKIGNVTRRLVKLLKRHSPSLVLMPTAYTQKKKKKEKEIGDT